MVGLLNLPASTAMVTLAQAAEPVIRRMDPATRVKILAALAAFVILGFMMMFFTWWGARATRRYMGLGKRKPRWTEPDPDDWSKKPLHPEE